jgi:hypothetical protein
MILIYRETSAKNHPMRRKTQPFSFQPFTRPAVAATPNVDESATADALRFQPSEFSL